MVDKKEKFILIDGNSLLYRAFFALPRFKTSTGRPTGATYGFLNMLLRVIEDYKPFSIVVAFDYPEKTFRHHIQKDYKAQRPPTPEDLKTQIKDTKEITKLLGFQVVEKAGYEADDLIGSIQKKLSGKFLILILSSDFDFLQLLDENTILLKPLKGVTQLRKIDLQSFIQEWSISPEQIVDCLTLCGDPSDNIKGITGIGEKTALQLIKKFGNLDNLIKHVDSLSPRLRRAIQENLNLIEENRQLLTIKRELSLDWDELIKPWSWKNVNWDALFAKLQELEFNKIIERLAKKRDELLKTSNTSNNCSPLTQAINLVFTDNSGNQKISYCLLQKESGCLQLEEDELVKLLEKGTETIMIHNSIFAFSRKFAKSLEEQPLKCLSAETILFLSFPALAEEYRFLINNKLFLTQPSAFNHYWEILEKAKENFEAQPSLIEFYKNVESTLQKNLPPKLWENLFFFNADKRRKNPLSTPSGLSLFEWNSKITFTVDTSTLLKKSRQIIKEGGQETWKNWVLYQTLLGLRYLPKEEKVIAEKRLAAIMVNELERTLLWALFCCNFDRITVRTKTIEIPYQEGVLPTLSKFLARHSSQLPICKIIQLRAKNSFEVQVGTKEENAEEVL
ncbi:MAG: hypothetical protein J7J32_01960 [Candidatus Atribacteria bacterium]|nr:hypothetical protein [Candidatus Atribacteria bacterium]MCD6349752.1 hypothetical protein [Candidatus Atribacteria bacterium]